MLKNDVIHNSSFRFRDINLDNINNIYLAINIIVIIATTLFKTFVVIVFVFKLVIIIVFDINNIVIVIIIVFKKPIFKLIVFDFDMKKRLIINASLDKS